MPTQEWLQQEFYYGYDSGDVLAAVPGPVREEEEKKCGGSYRAIFMQALFPHLKPDATVLELGPGRGSWSRAIMEFLPHGQLCTLDYQDVTPWLKPEQYQGRMICHRVADNSFVAVPDSSFDIFWSFGVLCHHNIEHVREILRNSLIKMKKGGIAIHQYADWGKLDAYGWDRGGVPVDFQARPDDQIWWPRNSRATMEKVAAECGWVVITPDLDLMRRDALIVLKCG